MIEVKNNTININGIEEFIFGGEIHYFRTPKSNWRMLIRKAKEAGCNLISTYIPWCWHEFEEGKFDFIGKTMEERNLVEFLKILKEEEVYCIVRPGPYVMSEIKNEGIPQWLLDKYEDIIAKDIDGNKHDTKVISYMHETYLERVKIWYEEVCNILDYYQFTKNGSIIMVQLDNEVGMLQWVTNKADYNKATTNYFKEYLIEKYKSLDEINKILQISAKGIDEVINEYLLRSNYINEKISLKIGREYSKFMRGYFRKYIEALKGYAEECGIEVPFIVNVHGFEDHGNSGRGIRYPIGLSQLYEAGKIPNVILAGDYYIRNISFDNYPDLIISNAFTKAIQNEEQPLFSAEFQGGGLSDRPRLQPSDIDLSTRVCIASEMNAINYYMFCSGENYENIGLFGRRHEWQAPLKINGEVRPHYNKIKSIGEILNTIGKELVKTKKVNDIYIGFNPDYYMNEYKSLKDAPVLDGIAGMRDAFQYDGMLKSLTQANISYEAIDLVTKDIDVDKVKTLWVFSSEYMDRYMQEKLKQYVKKGGTLVLYPTVPKYELNGDECTLLKDFLNIEIKESRWGRLYPKILHMDSVFSSFETILENVKGEVIAIDEDGSPCGFINNVSKGRILYLGVGNCQDYNYKIDLVKELCKKLGVTMSIEVNDTWINASLREGKDTSFILINNFDEIDKDLKVMIKGKEAFNGNLVSIKGRNGVILPVNFKISKKININWATAELTSIEKGEETILEFSTIRGKEYNFSLTFENSSLKIEGASIIDNNKGLKVLANEDKIKIII